MSMRAGCLGVLGLVCAAALSGCAGARYVSVDSTGGIVAIPSNTDCWPEHYRAKAEELMAKKCPQGYVIDHEEEVVTGTTQRTHTNTNTTGDPTLAALHIAPVKQETEESTDVINHTEWRIWFHAQDAPPPAAPVAHAPPPPVPVGNAPPPAPVPVALAPPPPPAPNP
jgi:hypothetical protein